ncbi:HlyD family efflux transporter periplasmic adaptor subunit [Alisedimentitalea sp. MJ-SS2]|uniref:efflux RND transporter periplasmic adaptor subunit n=1 Tax=Aliisedimentitalea sp. MJ-SS2 TaxID=3049795 RepID=UPI00290E88F6|nr:HlyD family efflux transporter periplasmic adaptor subunit [Alisedimentitalea sp. MJ-SS2]MDU8927342.1 HlyD family efflux transporter periplasmic adaptor subunit [Alisedimentitalea sp. MJ-SS2]
MAKKKHSRKVFSLIVIAAVAGALAYAFWPRPMLVDIGEVARRDVVVTINEEGRTQVHNTYVVSTPITGRLLRVGVEPGDKVIRGETVVARMLPTSPVVLDVRTREQAKSTVNSAEAALRVAQADINRARADVELAEGNLNRARKLHGSGIASDASLERDETAARLAQANLDTARAAVSMRIAELNNARAMLISFEEQGSGSTAAATEEEVIELHAPSSGVILQVRQQSETTLQAGMPIMEIGDVANDLEIVAELLSTDAVQVRVGARVIIDNWGGSGTLEGEVARIEPWGFTKFSALGVEEQRVRVTIHFSGDLEERMGLGHGFRVEARIVVWEADDAISVPASSLFRIGGDWAIFVVNGEGRADLRKVEVAGNNGLDAAITTGVSEGEKIILYPSAALSEGSQVAQRAIEG